MQSQMQRQCESQSYMKGFWAENCLGKGLRNSELNFFFYFLISHTEMQTALLSKWKQIFFPFFKCIKKNPQPCIISLSNPNT